MHIAFKTRTSVKPTKTQLIGQELTGNWCIRANWNSIGDMKDYTETWFCHRAVEPSCDFNEQPVQQPAWLSICPLLRAAGRDHFLLFVLKLTVFQTLTIWLVGSKYYMMKGSLHLGTLNPYRIAQLEWIFYFISNGVICCCFWLA